MIFLDPMTLTLTAPGSAVVAVKVGWMGEVGSITLATSSLPAHVTATVTPSVVGPDTDSAALTITVSAPVTGTVELDGTGFVRHGEAAGVATHGASVSVTSN